jgi:uncharacterized membrane protein
LLVPTVGRSPEDDHVSRTASTLAVRSLAGLAAGAVLAGAAATADQATGWRLPLSSASATPLAATLVGALLTIAVFTLWMRTVVVGLASAQLSPRVLSSYLDDRFQRTVTGWMVAAITCTTILAARLPRESEDVPAISTVLVLLVVIAALAALLLAMRHAVNSLSPPEVIRRLADTAFARLERQAAPDDPGPAATPDPAGWWPLRSDTLGWVQDLDHDALLAAVPPRTTVLLEVAVGEFVAVGEPLACLELPAAHGAARDGEGPAEVDERALLDAITIARTRDARDDLAFAVQQLVDVAQHAVAPSSLDTSTAHEALVHLRAVLQELLRHGTATGCKDGDEGRRVVSSAAWRPADHLVAVFERLRGGASQDPTSARHLARTLAMLRATAEEVGDHRAVEVLDEQHDRLVAVAADQRVPLTHR